MKTLHEIKTQTKEDCLKILKSFVQAFAKKGYQTDYDCLKWLFERASTKIDYKEPCKVEEGFNLYEIDIEYLRDFESQCGQAVEITVYVADKYDKEKGEDITYYAL